VLAVNAGGPRDLVDGKASGNPSLLNDEQRHALMTLVACRADPGGAWRRPLAANQPDAMGI
jgi:hypothetical protein